VDINTAFSETDPRTTTPVSNLSETGCFVHTDQLYPLGSRIELRFVVFPDNPMLFHHTGRIVRHSQGPAGMGVEFDPIPPQTGVLIRQIVERAEQDDRRHSSHRRTRSKRFVLRARDLQTKVIED
jgi:hypothetical protein